MVASEITADPERTARHSSPRQAASYAPVAEVTEPVAAATCDDEELLALTGWLLANPGNVTVSYSAGTRFRR